MVYKYNRGMKRTTWYYRNGLLDAELCPHGCRSSATCPEDANERHLALHRLQMPRTAKMVALFKEYDELLAR